MKIHLIKVDFSIGSNITILLISQKEITGKIVEFGDDYLVLDTFFSLITIYSDIIGGWIKNIETRENYINDNPSSFIEAKYSAISIEKSPDEISSEIEKSTNSIKDLSNEIGKNIYLDAEVEIKDIQLKFKDFDPEEIPWREHGITPEHLFKGRQKLIDNLVKHYKSPQRTTTYVLYGLTRTGKSSLLRFLSKELEEQTLNNEGKKYAFIPFNWDLSEAANAVNAEDMWEILLYDFTVSKILKLINEGKVPQSLDFNEVPNKKFRAKHLKDIITHLKKHNYFPIFLIDEFTYIENLLDKGIVDSAFLATIRKLTFDKLACFVFAGTYNLKQLVDNPKYGITGQLVNTKEEQVGSIDTNSAIDLINVFIEKVSFTPEAIELICELTNKVPYFIQIVCKNAALYSLHLEKNVLDEFDIESVVEILVGDKEAIEDCLVESIAAPTFMNNQIMPSDPKENHAVLCSICHFNKNNKIGKYIPYTDIQRLWGDNKIPDFSIRLNNAIEDLKSKGIVIEAKLDDLNAYKIGVDLFRRWWYNHHSDIYYELSALKSN